MSLTDLIGKVPGYDPLEDLISAYLKPLEAVVPGLHVRTWIEEYMTTPYILVRREPDAFAADGFGRPDARFIRRGVFKVETFTEDLDDGNGDERGARLQDIAFRCLHTAWQKNVTIPGSGYITELQTLSPAHRASDWATSTGVVQYANLPKNTHRYEATYGCAVRPDLDIQRDPLELFR